jgi:GT2 family glycosyltransferase
MNSSILSIIIISTNEGRDLKSCLESIYSSMDESLSFEIYVVDNNCSDGTSEMVLKSFPDVKLIINDNKMGFAYNNNIVIKKSNTQFVLLLNPDTTVNIKRVKEMIDYCNDNPDVALCGPKLLNPDGSLQYNCRRFPTISAVLMRWASIDKYFPNNSILKKYMMKDVDHNKIINADWLLGAFLLIKREVFDQVGYFDEKFWPLYYEDVDLCYRIKKAKYKVVYYPAVEVIHSYHRESAKGIFNKMTLYHMKNIARFFFKHGFNFSKKIEES